MVLTKEFKRLFFVSTSILLVIQFTLYYISVNELIDESVISPVNKQTQLSFDSLLLDKKLSEENIEIIVANQNNKKTISSTYKSLLKKYSIHLNDFTLKERCQLYFNEVNELNPNWGNGKLQESIYNFDVFNKNYYILTHKQELIDHKKSLDKSGINKADDEYITDDDYYRIEHLYNEDLKNTLETEQKYVDIMTNIRVYSQCYLSDNDYKTDDPINYNNPEVIASLNDKLKAKNLKPIPIDNDVLENNIIGQNKFQDLESRSFPWLSGQLPIYLRWNGETHWGIPVINSDPVDESNTFAANRIFQNNKGFLQNFKDSISDKGIVVTGSDHEVPDMINLIKLLRGLNNKLPIQIIHKGDISRENQHNLIRISQENIKLNDKIFNKIDKSTISTDFPKQELWFVNVSASIKPEYLEFFAKFYMKFLAYFFNSFEEVILMDADAIPLIDPIKFFELSAYKKSKTIFFKDRSSVDFIQDHDVIFFQKLLPSIVDENIFGVPKSSSKTLNNNFFAKKYKHSMEAGIIPINRKEKFTGMLALIQLQTWTPANKRVWGDKELFWLSLSMVGDENYEFNKHSAVSVGESVIEKVNINDKSLEGDLNIINYNKQIKICSSHPGHISGDDDTTLLWINSGFKVCKKDSWEDDMKIVSISHKFDNNVTLLKEYYESNLQIKSILLPGDNMYKRLPETVLGDSSIDKLRTKYGWDMSPECGAYNWCATEVMNDEGKLKNSDAIYIEFSDDLKKLYDYYGKLWTQDVFTNNENSIEVGEN